jgi:hypothetical protein
MMEGSMPEHGPRTYVIVAALIVVSGLSCNRDRSPIEQAERMAEKTIEQVQEEHTVEWMALPGVVGTAIGQCEGRPCILVLTASNTEQVRQKIPSTVEGYPVVVRFVGEIRALDEP